MIDADDIKRMYELHSGYCATNHRIKPQGFARCVFPWFDLLDGSDGWGHYALFIPPRHMRLYSDRARAEQDRHGGVDVLLSLDTGQILEPLPPRTR